MSEPPRERDADDRPAEPAADDASGGWTWGSLEGRTPGYGPAPTPGPDAAAAPAGPPPGPPQYGPPQYGPPQYGPPQYGPPQYGPPQYGAPQYGAPQYGAPQYGAPAGYAPMPVQRGIVPLRPLSLGEIYDGAFRAIRANPRVMFGFSMLVVGVASVLGGLAWYLVIPTVASWVDSTLGPEIAADDVTGDMFASLYSMYAMLPFLALAGIVLSGVLTVSVSRSVIGEKVGVGELWRGYWKRVLLVGAYTIALSLAAVVAWGLLILGIAAAGSASGAAAAVVGIVGAVGGFVVSVWVGYRLLFVPPVLMLEGGRLVPSIARAWRLTRGSFWRILGINLLAQVIGNIVSQVLSVPASIIGMFFLLDGTVSGGYVATMTVGMALAYTIPAIFLAGVVALQYIDVRIRREGLDVQLARAAEANAARAT